MPTTCSSRPSTFWTMGVLCKASLYVCNAINSKGGKTVGDSEIFSSFKICMTLWGNVNARRWIHSTAVWFSALDLTFTPPPPSTRPGAAYSLRVLIGDGGVAVLAEAGENWQHAASFLSPQRLALMEGRQLTEGGRRGGIREMLLVKEWTDTIKFKL